MTTPALPYAMRVSIRTLISDAQDLMAGTPRGDNPEYEKALIELISNATMLPADVGHVLVADALHTDRVPGDKPGPGTMTVQQVVNVGAIIAAAQNHSRIARLMPDRREEGPVPVFGQARAIVGGDDYNFPLADYDVRDCRLWVTMDNGMEQFWSLSYLLPELDSGHLIINPGASS